MRLSILSNHQNISSQHLHTNGEGGVRVGVVWGWGPTLTPPSLFVCKFGQIKKPIFSKSGRYVFQTPSRQWWTPCRLQHQPFWTHPFHFHFRSTSVSQIEFKAEMKTISPISKRAYYIDASKNCSFYKVCIRLILIYHSCAYLTLHLIKTYMSIGLSKT